MNVTLAVCTPNPIETIYRAYRLCYSKGKQMEIKLPHEDEIKWAYEEKDEEKIQYFHYAQNEAMVDFIVPLLNNGHTTPLEHVSMTFYISGVSRALTHQLVRHRTGKFNQQSQRYVDGNNFDVVVPPSIDGMVELRTEYLMLVNEIMRTYNKLIQAGVKKEDARYLLPNATTSNITVTFDANNLRKFLALRLCKHAQWEIRDLANEMYKLAKQELPFIGSNVMNCGRLCNRCMEGK